MRKLMASTRTTLLAAVLASATGFGAVAGPVTVGGGWVEFSFGGLGSSLSGEPFTFTLLSAGTLSVTDAYQSGDQFEIFENLVSIGLTSLPGSVGDQVLDNYDAALADPRWSSATFVLPAGSYSITGVVTLSPFTGGGGALRVDNTIVTDVPAPMSLALLSVGLLGLGLARRRA